MSALRPLGLLVLRDLRRLLAARASFIQRTVFLGVAALPLWMLLDQTPNPATLAWSSRMQMSVTRGWTLFGLYLVAPALGASAIRLEKEEASLDVLRASGFGERTIVWATAIANTLLVLFVAAALFPILGVGFVFGGVLPFDLLTLGVSVASVAFFAVSVGVLFGSYAPSGLAAYGRTVLLVYAPLLALSLGTLDWLSSGRALATALWLASPMIGPSLLPSAIAGSGGLPTVPTAAACAIVLGSAVGLSAVALEVAGAVLRRTGTREARGIGLGTSERRARAAGRRFGGTVGANPVAWRERRRMGLTLRHGSTVGTVVAFLALQAWLEIGAQGERALRAQGGYAARDYQALAEILPLLVALGAYVTAGLSGLYSVLPERRNGSFELLALTPIPALAQVTGKSFTPPLFAVALLGPPWLLHEMARCAIDPEASPAVVALAAATLLAGLVLLSSIGHLCSLVARGVIGALFSFVGIVGGVLVLALVHMTDFSPVLDPSPGSALTSPFASVAIALALCVSPSLLEDALREDWYSLPLLYFQGVVTVVAAAALLTVAAAGPIRVRVLARGEARAR